MAAKTTDLVVRVQGAILESNLDQYKQQIIAQIQAANKELKTDGDFTDAESAVKYLSKTEKAIIQSKSDALKQAADVQKLFEAMDEINEEVRQARLGLQRQIKARKEEIKCAAIDDAYQRIVEHYNALCSQSDNFSLAHNLANDIKTTLIERIKGLKTIKSIESNLTDAVDDINDVLSANLEACEKNAETINAVADEYASLFQDRANLLAMDFEQLSLTIDKRIATHQAEEAKRELLRQERLKREAEKAAEQEAKQKLTPEPEPKPDPAPAPVAAVEPLAQPEITANSFLITIQLECDKGAAVDFARELNNQFANNAKIKSINLKRG